MVFVTRSPEKDTGGEEVQDHPSSPRCLPLYHKHREYPNAV